MNLDHGNDMYTDVVQYQVKVNISELIGTRMELSQVI